MRPVIRFASALAVATLSACAAPPPASDTSVRRTPDVPASEQHWEPAPVVGALPPHPRNSTVFTGPPTQ